jgi:hypothetical protein
VRPERVKKWPNSMTDMMMMMMMMTNVCLAHNISHSKQ